MCGLAGALVFDSSEFRLNSLYIEALRDTMVHRGPDGCGTWINEEKTVGFGHRRLSIIDLSDSANQPMISEDQTITLVFNGEIYNHSEIRKELTKLNKYHWRTDHSDTEVLLYAYQEWGIEFVERLRGMFAIAIWDSSDENLLLIRDRVGIKPLYYSVHNNRVVFASEIKALLADPDQKRKINEKGLFDYLTYLTVPAPFTLFEGIKKIPGGTWIRFNKEGIVEEKKYWDVLDNTQNIEHLTDEEISSDVLEKLRNAVEIRKVSDVPVGVFLSGGIDSSCNAALFSDGEKEKVKTFSIGYDDNYQSYANELEYAKLAADNADAIYHEKLLSSSDLIEFLPEMIRLQDEPIGDPVCVPLYYVSELAKKNDVTVCQVGEGADELFWGYPHWKKVLKIQNLSDKYLPRFVANALKATLDLIGLNQDWRYEALKRVSNNQPIYWGPEPYTHNQKIKLFSKRMQKKFFGYDSWKSISDIRDKFDQKSSSGSNLDWMTYIDLNLRLPELLLMRVDKMSMGVSLEARVPFLDHKLVEYSMSIPEKMKTKNAELKYILKKSVRGIIPDRIIDRKKQGFSAPIQEWSKDSLKPLGKKYIKEFCLETDLLDWKHIELLIDGEDQGAQGKEWWPILNLAMWWSFYIKKEEI